MQPGPKTSMPAGVIHCRPGEMQFQPCDIYGTVLEKSPVFEGEHAVRSAYFRMKRGDVIAPHTHRKWVQVVVLDGEIDVAQGARTFTARAGDVYFLDPGHAHVETATRDSLLLVTQGEDRPGWPGA